MKTMIWVVLLTLASLTACLDTSGRKVGQIGDMPGDDVGADVSADQADMTEPPECQTNADCDDGDPCTTDVCHDTHAGIYCMNVRKTGCISCTGDADCDDGDDCTTDLCNEGICGYGIEPNGTDCSLGMSEGGQEMGVCAEGTCETFSCGTSVDCDDGDPCTQDFPDKDGCKNVPIDGCTPCERDEDCTLPDLCALSTAVKPACTSERICSFSYTYPDLSPYPYKNAVVCEESIFAGTQTGKNPIKYEGANGAPPSVCNMVNGGSNQLYIYAIDGPPTGCWCIDSEGMGYRPTITYVSSPEERWVLKCCGSPPEIR